MDKKHLIEISETDLGIFIGKVAGSALFNYQRQKPIKETFVKKYVDDFIETYSDPDVNSDEKPVLIVEGEKTEKHWNESDLGNPKDVIGNLERVEKLKTPEKTDVPEVKETVVNSGKPSDKDPK